MQPAIHIHLVINVYILDTEICCFLPFNILFFFFFNFLKLQDIFNDCDCDEYIITFVGLMKAPPFYTFTYTKCAVN